MRTRFLEVTNFRAFQRHTLPLQGEKTLIIGPNGSGKSSLIEAYGLLAFTRSFRTAREESIIRYGESLARVVLSQEVSLSCALERRERRVHKTFFKAERVVGAKDFIGEVKAVLFSSELVDQIRAGPAGRRRILNLLLSQWRPASVVTLVRYAKALTGRNALLGEIRARNQPEAVLDAWDRVLSEEGFRIHAHRAEFVAVLAKEFGALTKEFFTHKVRIEYLPTGHRSAPPPSPNALLEALRGARQRDISFGVTTIGPHRDDLAFNLEKHPLIKNGSRGEVRLVTLLFVLSAYRLLKVDYPATTFLFDDIASEFDINRLRALHRLFPAGTRLVATATEPSIETLFSDLAIVALEKDADGV